MNLGRTLRDRLGSFEPDEWRQDCGIDGGLVTIIVVGRLSTGCDVINAAAAPAGRLLREISDQLA